jgi:hypothetical protein
MAAEANSVGGRVKEVMVDSRINKVSKLLYVLDAFFD